MRDTSPASGGLGMRVQIWGWVNQDTAESSVTPKRGYDIFLQKSANYDSGNDTFWLREESPNVTVTYDTNLDLGFDLPPGWHLLCSALIIRTHHVSQRQLVVNEVESWPDNSGKRTLYADVLEI